MKVKTISSRELLYLRIAKHIEKQISSDVLKVGDKLPSIRMICREHGVSMNTAQYAYYELERKALIESRPQSGYYVSDSLKRRLGVPDTSQPVRRAPLKQVSDVFTSVFSNAADRSLTLFSMGSPSEGLLPLPKLKKAIAESVKSMSACGTRYEPIQGNEKLRRQIARWSFNWKGNITDEEVVITSGCMNAIAYCMMSLTKSGDTIAVESPCFFGILQLAQSLGLKVLELPTHPKTGVEIDALKKAVSSHKISLCLLVSNFSNPLGSLMPVEHKQAVVKLLEHYNVPLIEDDLYGDIYFGEHRPVCCKSFDESGNVLLCSSVSKTLAPGYRVGWVIPGRHKEAIIQRKLFQTLSSPTIGNEVIANFLENGRYESHLRQLRQKLHTTYLQYIRVIADHFPEETKLSRPQGGLSLWVELPRQVNVLELYNTALRHKISISPGLMFTLQRQFDHCMRLSFGLPWEERVEKDLKLLGKLVKQFM